MRETLYLRLKSTDGDAITSYCLTGAATHSWPVQDAPLREVLARAAGKRLLVLVPAADVRLLRFNVAARSAAKILQAAPYALEDQLAEDVEDLHFALGARQGDGSYLVAAVARARMDLWLNLLRDAQLQAEALIPEQLLLPAADEAWSALAEADQITVRTGAAGGFVCSPEDLPAMLQLADPERQHKLRIAIPRSYSADFTQLDWPLELLPGHASPLEALLHGHSPAQDLNLLQGAYSQSAGAQRFWLPWRPTAALAAALLLVAGAAHAVQAYSLGKELRVQDEQNEQRFRSLFPNETRIVDLNVQLDQQIAAYKGGSQGGGFLSLTETLSRALAAANGLSTQGLQFREGALYANLTGTDLQQLDVLKNWFAQNSSARLEVQSANSGSEGVQIRIKLEGA